MSGHRVKFVAVYAGRRQLVGGKLGQLWIKIDAAGALLEHDTATMGKGVKAARVGQVFRLAGEGGSIFIGGEDGVRPTYLRMWDDAAQRAAWAARDEAEQAAERERKRMKADGAVDPVDELLKPLVRAYLKTDRLGRQMMLAKMIDRLVRADIVGR